VWQDYALTVINCLFCIPLVPMLWSAEKPHMHASVPNGVLLCAAAGVMYSLGFWFTAATQAIVGTQWLVLAYQKWRQTRA